MGVVIESDRWEMHPSAFLVLFAACFASIFLLPYFSRSISGRGAGASSLFDLDRTAPFLRFQSGFLMLYALASVMQGVESVFGEYEFTDYGISREQMAWYLAIGALSSLIFGTLSGILFDIVGARKACLLFCFLHIFLGALKSLIKHPIVWMSNICLSVASSVFSFCYETWMVIEHEKPDKNILVLMWAQASIHFSMSVFWILWAPTIVADGREVNLSLIYPVLIGSRMLGSTAFPWLFSEAKLLGNEDCLTTALGVAGISLFIVAYDYQEIGVLVLLFCIFHACVGFSLPSLARLRTIYLPNELRSGMIAFSLAPANAALLFVLLQGGYHRNLENSTIMALAAFGLLIAAGCIYKLRSWRKMSRQNWHNI